MKKTYSAPAIKVSKIDTESLMTAASPNFGGNIDTTLGNSTSGVKPGPESTGRAKSYNVWDDVNADDEE